MVTRFYYEATTDPGITPAFDSNWTTTAAAVRRKMRLTQDAATETLSGTLGGAAGNTALAVQLISDPLQAQTFPGSGFVLTHIGSRGRELAGTDNINKRYRILKVISNDGTVERATLAVFATPGATTELSTTLSGQVHTSGGQLTAYTCVDGDRLLLEIGYGESSTGTTPNWQMVIGGTGTDHASGSTANNDTTGTVPWWELAIDVAFLPSGTQFEQNLAGSTTPAGALTKQVNLVKAGQSTPAGVLTRFCQKVLAGATTPAGALTNSRVVLRAFAGSFTPTGALTRQANKALAGATTPAGALAKLAGKVLSGSITPAGALTNTKVVLRAFAGSISPAGVLAKQANKALPGSTSPSGALAKRATKAFSGALTPSGALAATRVISIALGGLVAPTGALTKRASKALAGLVTPTGSPRKQIVKALVGAFAPWGAVDLTTVVPVLFGRGRARQGGTTGGIHASKASGGGVAPTGGTDSETPGGVTGRVRPTGPEGDVELK